MKREFRISRIFICVIVLLGSQIVFVNEDISMKIAGSLVLVLASFISVYITAPISRKLIAVGDGIRNLGLRVLYYIGLLPAHILAALAGVFVLSKLARLLPEEDTLAGALSQAILMVAFMAVVFLMFIIPYIQTIFVLAIRSWGCRTRGSEDISIHKEEE